MVRIILSDTIDPVDRKQGSLTQYRQADWWLWVDDIFHIRVIQI